MGDDARLESRSVFTDVCRIGAAMPQDPRKCELGESMETLGGPKWRVVRPDPRKCDSGNRCDAQWFVTYMVKFMWRIFTVRVAR